ncbi:hypothetical protein [Cupriavidus pauculus]|uniref:hypothetical protein n=1 Tax=Cupriavidus pauculus TaxID=82633 RepID=UPI000A6C5AA4|nr:hypothetical protein [Cupriavidus pauculus]
MSVTNQAPFIQEANIAAFREKLDELRSESRSFAAHVRTLYFEIESAVGDGIPLNALLAALNGCCGLNGTLAAFKSALHRIRQEEAVKRPQWVSRGMVHPVPSGDASLSGTGGHGPNSSATYAGTVRSGEVLNLNLEGILPGTLPSRRNF